MKNNHKVKFKAQLKYDDREEEGYYFYDSDKNKHFIITKYATGDLRQIQIKEETLRMVYGTEQTHEYGLVGNVVHECLSEYTMSKTKNINDIKRLFHTLYDKYVETLNEAHKEKIWQMINDGMNVMRQK